MKLTVYSFNSLVSKAKVGDKLLLADVMERGFNKLEAILDGEVIGTCSESEHMLLPSTNSKKDIDEFIKKNGGKVEAKVLETNLFVNSKNGNKVNAIIVEVLDKSEEVSNGEELVYHLKINGNVKISPGKPLVLKALREGNKIFGKIKLNDIDNKIAFISNINGEDIQCGTVAEAEGIGLSSLSEIENLKNYLKIKKIALAETTDTFSQGTYIIKVIIKEEEKKVLKEISINSVLENISKDEDEEYNATVRKIVTYLQDNSFSAKQIEEIISSHNRDYDDRIKSKIPKEPKVKYLDNEEVNALKISYGALKMGWHILARGPKGSGKNEFTKTLAWIYQKPLYDLTFNRDIDKIDLQGGNTLEAVEEGGVTKNTIKFAPEILLEAMENGGLFVADEINFAEPGILGLLNPITDTRGSIQVPGYRKVESKKGFCLIGTMNEGYEGTNELNQALNDRFIHIPFKAPRKIYNILKQEYPTIEERHLIVANDIYMKILALVEDGIINPDCLTIRGFIQAIPFIEILGQEKAFISCVANKVLDLKYREDILSCISESVIK